MIFPIRKRIGLTELVIAGAVGVFAQLYVWTPTIKEKLEKEKQLKQSTETKQTTEADPKT